MNGHMHVMQNLYFADFSRLQQGCCLFAMSSGAIGYVFGVVMGGFMHALNTDASS